MDRKSFILIIAVLIILAGGAGYYLWSKQKAGVASPEGIVITEPLGPSFLDDFFSGLLPDKKKNQDSLKEYADAKGIFSIHYPVSWVVRPDQGKRLTGVNITPQELLNRYPSEEQGFVKGLVVSADESDKSPEEYFKNLVGGGETGQTEAESLTIGGYPAYTVKGSINGVSYVIYIVSHNNRIVYFNYRTKEDESAHQKDIKKSIDFVPYIGDFEAAIASIKFLK